MLHKNSTPKKIISWTGLSIFLAELCLINNRSAQLCYWNTSLLLFSFVFGLGMEFSSSSQIIQARTKKIFRVIGNAVNPHLPWTWCITCDKKDITKIKLNLKCCYTKLQSFLLAAAVVYQEIISLFFVFCCYLLFLFVYTLILFGLEPATR